MADEASFFEEKAAGFEGPNFLEKNKLTVVLGMIGLLLLSFGALFFIIFSSKEQAQVEIISSSQAESPIPEFIFVHVAGAVEKPGLYQLQPDARVNDALIAAGGLSVEADREWVAKNINLAQKLSDGIKVYIPMPSEQIGKESVGVVSGLMTTTGKININTASTSELESLPRIGPVTAQKIIDYREANGLFQNPKDLMKVPGIGEKTYQDLSDKIVVF